MDFCHKHNLVEPASAEANLRYGIRVRLPANDTLGNIIGDDWDRLHWYSSEAERDRAFEQMATRHGYYRQTDSPTQVLEKLDK